MGSFFTAAIMSLNVCAPLTPPQIYFHVSQAAAAEKLKRKRNCTAIEEMKGQC